MIVVHGWENQEENSVWSEVTRGGREGDREERGGEERGRSTMSGHVPKYGAHNGVDFSEVFTLARTGGKTGSGDSGASQQDQQRRNPRGPAGGGSTGAGAGARRVAGSFDKEGSEPQRRGSGSHERETSSTRSSMESNRPTRGAERESSVRGGGGGRGGGRNKPRNINDEYAGASHLPKFGDWNTSDAGDANYTVMFSAASKERQTGSTGDMGGRASGGKGSGDLYKSSNGLPKKQSSSWWCFS